MAYGGWIMNQVQIGPYAGEDDTNLAAATNALVNGLAALSGWSVKKAATKHSSSTRGYHAVAQHTGGAELAILWMGTALAATHWNTVNHRTATASGSASDHQLLIAYMPPGLGAFDNAKDPIDVDWITGTGLTLGFKLYWVVDTDGIGGPLAHIFDGTSYAVFSWLARGDDVQLASALSAQASLDIDFYSFWGTGIDPLAHASDTEAELYLAYLDGTISYGDTPVADFHNEAGDQLLKGTVQALTNFLSATYTSGPPYNVVQMPLVNDLAEGAVYGTDGVKGKVSNELLFLSPIGAAPKSTWNSQVMVHLREGVWVGYDASNGAWP